VAPLLKLRTAVAVVVAGVAKIEGVTDVATELDVWLPMTFVQLLLSEKPARFRARAIAVLIAEVADAVVGDVEGRQTAGVGERVGGSGCRRRSRCSAGELVLGDVIAENPKRRSVKQAGINNVVGTPRNTLILNGGSTGVLVMP